MGWGWALIRGWAVIRINTVYEKLKAFKTLIKSFSDLFG